MASFRDPDGTFLAELNSIIATLGCMAEYVAERGDRQAAQVLLNTADLLEVGIGMRLAARAESRPASPAPLLLDTAFLDVLAVEPREPAVRALPALPA